MSTTEMWQLLGPILDEAFARTEKFGRAMEDALFELPIDSPARNEAWEKSEAAQSYFDGVQTVVRRLLPVSYIGSIGVLLTDGTHLKFPQPLWEIERRVSL